MPSPRSGQPGKRVRGRESNSAVEASAPLTARRLLAFLARLGGRPTEGACACRAERHCPSCLHSCVRCRPGIGATVAADPCGAAVPPHAGRGVGRRRFHMVPRGPAGQDRGRRRARDRRQRPSSPALPASGRQRGARPPGAPARGAERRHAGRTCVGPLGRHGLRQCITGRRTADCRLVRVAGLRRPFLRAGAGGRRGALAALLARSYLLRTRGRG